MTEAVATPTPEATGRVGGIVWTLRVTAVVNLILVIAQPVWIGLYASGFVGFEQVHSMLAGLIGVAALVLLIASVLAWKPGGGGPLAFRVSLAFFVFIIIQTFAGVAHVFALHFPIGVLMAIGALQLNTMAWKLRLPAKKTGGA
ncbi:MAG TPA: hypothetical protein VE172_00740 [Stackebrandtia sp.]|uniref:hypothetical protein n=1 Tax=Stackebrandtia sp. TaxID=2023065 RepID=UPI002D2A4B8E|nr:hypothetical protein [Stackebrandtia sp.]HZE37316.1 hypothetical protein [Stackebrandtia sp.]